MSALGRRGLLRGLGAALLVPAAPAIVRAASLMAIKPLPAAVTAWERYDYGYVTIKFEVTTEPNGRRWVVNDQPLYWTADPANPDAALIKVEYVGGNP